MSGTRGGALFEGNRETLAAMVRGARNAQAMSMGELAVQSGVSISTIQRIEGMYPNRPVRSKSVLSVLHTLGLPRGEGPLGEYQVGRCDPCSRWEAWRQVLDKDGKDINLVMCADCGMDLSVQTISLEQFQRLMDEPVEEVL